MRSLGGSWGNTTRLERFEAGGSGKGFAGVGKDLLGWAETAINIVPTRQGVPSFGVHPLPDL